MWDKNSDKIPFATSLLIFISNHEPLDDCIEREIYIKTENTHDTTQRCRLTYFRIREIGTNCLAINRSKVNLGGLRTYLNDLKEKGWVIRSTRLFKGYPPGMNG